MFKCPMFKFFNYWILKIEHFIGNWELGIGNLKLKI